MKSFGFASLRGWLARRQGRRSNGFKLAVSIAAPLASILAIEIGFRVRAHVRNTQTLEAAFTVPEREPPNGRTRFIDIIRPNPNDRIIYELRPNLRTTFKDRPFSTNSHGFRSPEVPLTTDEGTLTIAGIGASIMFGHGVGDGESYPAVLEELLNETYPAKRWRFINTSVPSYNVVMKVETLKEKGLAFEPDLVLLGIASNNLGLPQYVRVEEDPLDIRRSFILDFFRDLRAGLDQSREQSAVLAHVVRRELSWGRYVTTNPEKIPPRYRGLVGWEPFHRALDELARLRDEHGFEVITFATLDVDLVTPMLEAARERGFVITTLMDELIAYMKRTGSGEVSVERYARSELVVGPSNLHPSPLQHRAAAERLLSGMQEHGIIARLLARE